MHQNADVSLTMAAQEINQSERENKSINSEREKEPKHTRLHDNTHQQENFIHNLFTPTDLTVYIYVQNNDNIFSSLQGVWIWRQNRRISNIRTEKNRFFNKSSPSMMENQCTRSLI